MNRKTGEKFYQPKQQVSFLNQPQVKGKLQYAESEEEEEDLGDDNDVYMFNIGIESR